MASTVTFEYNGSGISPRPIISLNKVYQKSADGTPLGTLISATLANVATPLPAGSGGIDAVMNKTDDLRGIFAKEGKKLEILCGTTTILEAYPRVNSIRSLPTSNQWVQTAAYEVDLEWDVQLPEDEDSTLTPFISEGNESWGVEVVDNPAYYSWALPVGGTDAAPYQLRLSHSVSAVGKSHYSAGGLDKVAWQQARDWVIPRLGYDADRVEASGVLNFSQADFTEFNHVRSEQVNELTGNYAVNESWIVINPSGAGVAGSAIEDFSAEMRKSIDTGLTSVSINGNIRGLESRNYGSSPGDFSIVESKHVAASSYWSNIESRLLGRARYIADGESSRTLNSDPISRVVGHNPTQGTISYSFAYNDRPTNIFSGVLSEIITVNDALKQDIFAELSVLGRAAGGLLQSMNTKTALGRDLSIELIVLPATGGIDNAAEAAAYINQRPNTDTVVQSFEDDLTNNYGSVFRARDDIGWQGSVGRYSRSVAWRFNDCS